MTVSPQSQQPQRVLIAAFEGWSDAGSATTTALQHLGDLLQAELLHTIGSDGFIDFQIHRPKVSFDDSGHRVIEWPESKLYGTVHRPGKTENETSTSADQNDSVRYLDGTPVHDLFLLAGVEPSRDWVAFADEIVELVAVWAIDTVVILGTMFSDAPHSRPIMTTVSSDSQELRASVGAKRSDYEGPVGITTVLDIALHNAGVPSLSLWAQIPHYVHSAPSPKATLALLDKLEELLDVVIPRGNLLSEATEWEANINRIAAGDEDMARYIQALEAARDATNAPEATGEAIAHEFEKFLNIDAEHNDNQPWQAVADEQPTRDASSDPDSGEASQTESDQL